MIVDTSALIAILRAQDDAPFFAQALSNKEYDLKLSAANYLEAAIVIDSSRDPIASRKLDELITKAEIAIEPITAAQAKIAREAYRDFGKGSGHPARLNFGDCLAYALAKDKDEPLLFKGNDFDKTDLKLYTGN